MNDRRVGGAGTWLDEPGFSEGSIDGSCEAFAEALVVSWNFRHIVRFDKIRMFNAANRELGYKEVEIYSPRDVTRYEEG